MMTNIVFTDGVQTVTLASGVANGVAPVVGDYVEVPYPIAAPVPGSVQSLTVTSVVYRYRRLVTPPVLLITVMTDGRIL